MPEIKLYTVEEVAKLLRKHPDTIRRLIRQKIIPARKVGKTWYITDETLHRLLSADIEQ